MKNRMESQIAMLMERGLAEPVKNGAREESICMRCGSEFETPRHERALPADQERHAREGLRGFPRALSEMHDRDRGRDDREAYAGAASDLDPQVHRETGDGRVTKAEGSMAVGMNLFKIYCRQMTMLRALDHLELSIIYGAPKS